MSEILDQIVAAKRVEVEHDKRACPLEDVRARAAAAPKPRDFFAAVSRVGGQPNLIAEIKAASPSAGVIRATLDPAEAAKVYEQGGAAALSVLTERKFFRGDPAFVEQAKRCVMLPVLRKDFLIDPYQVHQSRAIGADAVLLIVEVLGLRLMPEMLSLAAELGMTVLLEVYERKSMAAVAALLEDTNRGTVLVGINNRNLKTQQIDLGNTERLAELVPTGYPLVSESGVKTRADVRRLKAAGADALLIGETLMRSGDPAATIRELFA